jgi:large conductance mechanosensitive channel
VFKEFKEFIQRGNVLDMVVGIIIGVAFGKVVTSIVNDIIMPPVGLLLGKLDFANMFVNLSGKPYGSLAAAKAAGAATINYGLFINTVIDFLIVSLVLFLVIRQANRMKRTAAVATVAPALRECPFCCTPISVKATRCPHCTSEIKS